MSTAHLRRYVPRLATGGCTTARDGGPHRHIRERCRRLGLPSMCRNEEYLTKAMAAVERYRLKSIDYSAIEQRILAHQDAGTTPDVGGALTGRMTSHTSNIEEAEKSPRSNKWTAYGECPKYDADAGKPCVTGEWSNADKPHVARRPL